MDTALRRERLIAYLGRRIAVAPPASPLFISPVGGPTVGFVTADGTQHWYSDSEQLGVALADDVGFRALQLGSWLKSPDGSFIAEAVGQLIPPEYRPEYRLVVEALELAASHQHEAGQQQAIGIAILAAAALVLLRLLADS
jgi:hypothetical protein